MASGGTTAPPAPISLQESGRFQRIPEHSRGVGGRLQVAAVERLNTRSRAPSVSYRFRRFRVQLPPPPPTFSRDFLRISRDLPRRSRRLQYSSTAGAFSTPTRLPRRTATLRFRPVFDGGPIAFVGERVSVPPPPQCRPCSPVWTCAPRPPPPRRWWSGCTPSRPPGRPRCRAARSRRRRCILHTGTSPGVRRSVQWGTRVSPGPAPKAGPPSSLGLCGSQDTLFAAHREDHADGGPRSGSTQSVR